MSRDVDIVVVGAGVIGAVAATLLVERRIVAPGRIAIVTERQPAAAPAGADWDLRVFALSRASERLLQLCGVWRELPSARVGAYQGMCVWDAAGSPDGKGSLRFDAAEIGEANLGFIAEGRALQMAGNAAARAAGVVMLEGSVAALSVGDGAAQLRLADGRELACQLVLAADGTGSTLRGLAGIDTAGHSYHQDALVAHVRTERAHRDTAWQRFLPTGPLALLPLPDGRSSLVWSTASGEAARLAALDPAAFAEALTEASGAVLGRCELTTPLARYPLRLQYATEYVRPRIALLGDAAHVVHPLAGQGLNLGLLDVATLAEVLQDVTAARSLGDLRPLRRYERWRKSENLAAATALDALERLFASDNRAVQGIRAAGLGAVGRSGLLKREFARRALGLAGDVPALLRAAGPASLRR
jgi:2-octaprenylphenol hydroxylase